MNVLVLSMALLLAVAANPPAKTELWLGEFPAFPGARQLCRQHVLGSSEGKRVEIDFTLYATSREPDEVAGFYADVEGIPWKPGDRSITVRRAEGRKILSVHPVSERYPECGVKPDSRDRTVIVVSEKTP